MVLWCWCRDVGGGDCPHVGAEDGARPPSAHSLHTPSCSPFGPPHPLPAPPPLLLPPTLPRPRPRPPLLQEDQRELAKTIRVSGSILLSTVSNFLDFFKIGARGEAAAAAASTAVLHCGAAATQRLLLLLTADCGSTSSCALRSAVQRRASSWTLCGRRWTRGTWSPMFIASSRPWWAAR